MADDLPLLANVQDILVNHYIFKFVCDFEQKCFLCDAVLFLEPIVTEKNQTCTCLTENLLKSECDDYKSNVELSNNSPFALILDCHKIKVTDVSTLHVSDNEYEQLKFSNRDPCSMNVRKKLFFLTCEWSLKIWSPEGCQFCFPKVIQISYETVPSAPSLLWVRDQDLKPSVFTYGATINNRSLFPCQEPPVAMATWEATVTAPKLSTVLMSGDEEPTISLNGELKHFYYFTKKALPLSTLCLAIGFWKEHVISEKYESCPKCRIFSPSSIIDVSVQELFEYVPYCIKISEDMLGPYPFPRIDFLIVPPTFGSLGMASPNVIFLSQSVLIGDGSMCSRVSHEIAHGWFGLLIGALDWTEEWLSEGFATFLEDHLHTWTTNMSVSDAREYVELRSIIRRKTLLDEVRNTEEDLQILRLSKGVESKSRVDNVSATVIKNGQNPIKGFIQVHYIKGYFLLKYLSDSVGIDNFMNFLRAYIKTYAGQLVTSKDFLNMYLNYFPSVNVSLETVYEKWLHNAGIPRDIMDLSPSHENILFAEVSVESKKWGKLNAKYLQKQKAKKKKTNLDYFTTLTVEQTILLFENLLEFEQFSTRTLKHLKEVYSIHDSNPEIQHRWFELVVLHEYQSEYPALKKFLTNHLAMGVYLYNEMLFSPSATLKTIARECYDALKADMEPNFQLTIEQMIQDSHT